VVSTKFGFGIAEGRCVINLKNMPDDPKIDQAAGEGTDKGAGAGEGQDNATDDKEKGAATDTGKEDAGKGEGRDGGEGADKDLNKGQDENKNAKAPEKKDTSKDNDADDGAEPEVKPRMSTKDFIIQRQQRKLNKAKAGDGEGKETGEDDEEVAPEDEALINKVVSKTFAPIIDKTLAAEDEQEIQSFLKDNPDFKPFEAKARRYMQHPSRRQLPVKSIFYEVAGDKLLKIGADRGKAADEKAKNTQTGGGSNRAGEGAKSDWDLPKDEFEAKQERVRRGQQAA
jgi:hypothetical protein